MQIFQGSENELKQRFGLSPLAIMFVGVLRSKNVYLTEPVLELCIQGSPLERFIKDRFLPSAVENPDQFSKLQNDYQLTQDFPLAIINRENRRVIALEAELVAESGWYKDSVQSKEVQPESVPGQKDTTHPSSKDERSEPTSKDERSEPTISKPMIAVTAGTLFPSPIVSSIQPSTGGLATPQLYLQGFENLFTRDEIAKLKVVIATAVKAEEKVEAIRKMILAQVPLNEKGILFLHALGDPRWEVRKEAAHALSQIGFNQNISETIISLSTGDDKQRTNAIYSLGQLFKTAQDLEKGVILQILLTTLQDKSYRECQIAIVEIIANLAGDIPSNPSSMMERIVCSVNEVLVNRLDELIPIASKLFQELAKKSSTILQDCLWNEIPKMQFRRVRAFMLTILADSKIVEEKQKDLAEKVVYELGLGDELDPVYLRLTGAITSLGDRAIPTLLDRLQNSIRGTEKIQIVKLLNKIFTEQKIAVELKHSVFKAYIAIFPTAPDMVREILLDNSLIQDDDVSQSLKTDFASEALVDIHKEKLDQYHNAVKASLSKMQKGALEALMKVLKKPLHSMQGLRSAEILGDVMIALPASGREDSQKVKEFCLKQIKAVADYRGELFKVLGKIAYSEAACKDMAEDIALYLFNHLCKTSYPYQVLEGLAWASAGSHTSHKVKMDVCYLFMTLMDKRLPENICAEKNEGENKIFEVTTKTNAYTDLLPVLTNGLRMLGVCGSATSTLRKSIVSYFLQKWDQIVSYKVIWGPKNTMDLAEAMHDLCLHRDVSLGNKVAIARALYQKSDIFTITEILASLFSQEAKDSEMAQVAMETSKKLLEFANSPEYNNAEDKEIIMRCIGRIITAEKLADSKKTSEEMRERLLYALFEGLREQVFGVRTTLQHIQECPHIPQKMKKEIQKRISQPVVVKEEKHPGTD